MCNIQRSERHRQKPYNQQINSENVISNEKRINPSVFTSFRSLERYFNIQANTQQNIVVNNYIVPDSDKEYSSSSDMFRDSLERQDTISSVRNELFEESDLTNENSVKNCSLLVQDNAALKNAYSEEENDLVVPSDDNNFSDITLFNENCSLYKQNCNQSRIQLTSDSNGQTLSQACDWNFYNCPVISSSQISVVESPQKDSAYDTYQLSVERVPTSTNCNSENKDVSTFCSQNFKSISKDYTSQDYERHENANDDELEFFITDITENGSIFDQSRQLCLSPLYQESNRSANSIKLCTYSGRSQRCKNLIEDREYEARGSKRKKFKSVHKSFGSKVDKKEETISSQWLGFMLDTLNVDAVTLQSVKMIFSVLQHEKIAKEYMRKRCWKDTLEQQAVNAILDFCDIFESRNKTNIYTQEIVQIVIGMLDKIIGTTELNKVNYNLYYLIE